ncbi:MAG TPA: biotin carboxylase N-terminal domain-containing protein [Dermatophilaceae bacterium]|nr:biotin carboxylase N-terminal domain-containing protein [Dermatophilaceae bacterium]
MTTSAISSVLVANRGEIARRVFRTCRDLGLATVAIHSTPDTGSPHVREADAAVHLPGSSPTETYLRGDLVIEAAKRAGADAIHPGYGFLSENAEFARAVLDAGLVWVGPPPGAIAAMGSKVEAKRLMGAAGVPVLPELDPTALTEADLPVLVKASAGGGGRGMRVVRSLADLPAQLEAARAEAASAFGDPTVFCEPYLESGHHVEVQVLADQHGTVWAVGERECSIQRRHQKVIEEAPSPLVERLDNPAEGAASAAAPDRASAAPDRASAAPDRASAAPDRASAAPSSLRQRLYAAATSAARAIGYQGAGTVEFLADASGRFFFLEMNTRLQVEHPVTELTTGLDLVRLQLEVAEGQPLPDQPPEPSGWAIEARLYAEDPAQGWQPQSGTLHRLHVPGVKATFDGLTAPGIRLDSGVDDGSDVSVFYDPMLAKVVAWAPRRAEAARALASALAGADVHGLRTNRDLLVRVLRHDAFLAGDTDTAFFERHGLAALSQPLADGEAERLSALAAALADAAANRAGARVQAGLPSGWRNLPSQLQCKELDGPSGRHRVEYGIRRGQLDAPAYPGVRLLAHDADQVCLEVDGVRRAFSVHRYGAQACVDSPLGPVTLTAVDRFPDPSAHVVPGSLLAPMPGVVVSVAATLGDAVERGAPLLVLEAMKMRHPIAAPVHGVLTELHVRHGQHVEVGAVLAVVTAHDNPSHENPSYENPSHENPPQEES